MENLTFKELLAQDVQDVFLSPDYSVEAIFKSGTDIKTITVQHFRESLDKMDTIYDHVWCSMVDIPYVKKHDTLIIDNIVYGIVDSTPDEFHVGINLFLNKSE